MPHRSLGRSNVRAIPRNWEAGVAPWLVQGIHQLLMFGAREGILGHVTSARRSHTQQRRLYAQYLKGMTLYPVAPPGLSDHERGLAVDVWTGSEAGNQRLGMIWRQMGGAWSPRDSVHFTYRRAGDPVGDKI